MLDLKSLRRPLAREALIFCLFLLLTAVMTWPAARMLRDGVTDPADPYILAWTLWWDFHQTFTDPLNLFHANIFYPYRYTLAFSENDYGIAMLFFPLFALGARPLTVHNVAVLVGFTLCGYGAFRLARSLTDSNGAAWIAGIAFAFVPYRFHKLPHLHYLFAGWLPLLLEALILFARDRSWKRASWLGVAFVMNALSCITWFVLSLVPLGLTALFLVLRYRLERSRAFWLRGGAVMFVSLLVLLPFLLPYRWVAQEYGFVWKVEEALAYSATPMNWLAVDWRNKLWSGLGGSYAANELSLFPGLLPLLFALAALLLAEPAISSGGPRSAHPDPDGRLRRALLVLLDATALLAIVSALLAAGYDKSRLQFFGVQLLGIIEPGRALAAFTLALCARCAVAYPQILRRRGGARNLIETLRAKERDEAVWTGAIWVLVGFCGSFGMNFFFHRTLYDFAPLFRGMRAPARWAMIAYVGLAVLAGVGAMRLVRLIARHRPGFRAWAIYALIGAAFLYEQRVAPLTLVRGEADPDAITLRLRETPMRGGIVEVPVGGGTVLAHRYMLRAADHARPIVTATSSFVSPIVTEIESLSRMQPIPNRFLDLLEGIPASYLVVHNASLLPASRLSFDAFLNEAVAAGRLRFVRRFGEADDLYAVTRVEPQAVSETPMPAPASARELIRPLQAGTALLPQDFQQHGYFIYRLHKAYYGRLPRLNEFLIDMKTLERKLTGATSEQDRQEIRRAFIETWMAAPPAKNLYDGKTNEQFVEALLANM